jgi:transposase
MRFYTQQHKYYCGIDLHARVMYVCILDSAGNTVFHKNMAAGPGPFLAAIAPYREDIVVGVECIFTWYWLADLCAEENIAFVLGHALYMKAIHGGKAKSDKIDSLKIATILRGGAFPLAYVYPREMRATRDLMRRRCRFARQRAALLAHIHMTASQYNLPPIESRLSHQTNRAAVAEHFPDPQVRKSIECDISLIDHYDKLLNDLELHIVRTAKVHDANTFYLLRSVPGIGKILSLVLLYEIHDIRRFPTVQDFASHARLVKCAHESAGKRKGYGGAKIGSAYLKWAFSEAATLFLRLNPLGQAFFARLEQAHGNAKARTVLAHKLGRAVYFMLQNKTAFDLKKFVGKAATQPGLGLQAQADGTAPKNAPHPVTLLAGSHAPRAPRSERALAARALPAKKTKKKAARSTARRSDGKAPAARAPGVRRARATSTGVPGATV